MTVKEKYQSVLNLGEQLKVQNGKVEEKGNVLHVWGTVETQHEKNQLWDAIKEAGGANPADIVADIQVSNPNVFAKHTVEKGESLSKIAKHYYDDMMKYKAIFEANRDILDNADVIHPGQVLTIPNI
ncbi:MAG: LysM peptidoglycan-binding domain-containing protein [Saprospiraceae bacterium]|nr:LysM peptidoglycan-binding domain-containing protein [Saprospiraceae bacterium]